VAQQVHEEGATQVFIDSFVGQKVANVEKVSGMLPVKSGYQLSGV
jgi:hypothetical protein